MSLAEQATACHYGIMEYMQEILSDDDIRLFWQRDEDFFAEYWIMSKQNFNKFMQWLYPFLKDGLNKTKTHPYLKSPQGIDTRSSLGYVLERLFILWRHRCKLKTYVLKGDEIDPFTMITVGVNKTVYLKAMSIIKNIIKVILDKYLRNHHLGKGD